jgi:hypothetical protein
VIGCDTHLLSLLRNHDRHIEIINSQCRVVELVDIRQPADMRDCLLVQFLSFTVLVFFFFFFFFE